MGLGISGGGAGGLGEGRGGKRNRADRRDDGTVGSGGGTVRDRATGERESVRPCEGFRPMFRAPLAGLSELLRLRL